MKEYTIDVSYIIPMSKKLTIIAESEEEALGQVEKHYGRQLNIQVSVRTEKNVRWKPSYCEVEIGAYVHDEALKNRSNFKELPLCNSVDEAKAAIAAEWGFLGKFSQEWDGSFVGVCPRLGHPDLEFSIRAVGE